METKRRSGSERVKQHRGAYAASEREFQSAFSPDPSGMLLRPLAVVEALHREAAAPLFALLLAPHPGEACHGSRWLRVWTLE
jgi:hypothetical protein